MVGGRVGFLVAGLWEGVRGIIEKCFFDQLFFACCRSMSLHISAATLAFLLFFRVLGGLAHHKHSPQLQSPKNNWKYIKRQYIGVS